MASIRLEQVNMVYPGGPHAVHDLNLEIADHELLVLVGPSGCGKTTTLRLVAGLEAVSGGRIYIDELDVTNRSPRERDLAMVFQNYALYPHMTVRKNLEFGLRMQNAAREAIHERVPRIAGVLGIDQLLQRMPGQLSGGQRQRVALGRAMVREPRAFLLDEPLSNLDAGLRVQMRTELARLQRRLGATMIYVTHDQEEAMTLGDRIAVMRDGQLQQLATPTEVYRRPANLFVAGFIGAPAMNLIPCTSHRDENQTRIKAPFLDLATDAELIGHSEVTLGIRPQDIELIDDGEADAVGRVDVKQTLGRETLVYLVLGDGAHGTPLTVVMPSECTIKKNDRVGLRFPRERLHFFASRTGERLNL